MQHEAEALTEQWHAAQDDVTARRAELGTLRDAIDPARSAADAARGDEEHYREQVDTVALSTFESGRLDAFNALLASETPQDYLDQMSALEMIAADHAAALDKLTSVVDRTRRAQDDADAAAARAQTAADEAARAEQELAGRKRDADRRIDEAEALLRRLTPRERRDYLGPEVDAPALPSGSGAGVRALRTAAGQLGKAYRWGAAGPRSFDCSGLTSFSFRQAGITLPRSSSQQARVGRSGRVRRPAARRPRVLPQPRQPRGHLRRRREDDPRAADRRRGALPDRQPEHVQRRPPPVDPELRPLPVAGGGRAPAGRRPTPRGRPASITAGSGRAGVARTLLVTNDFPPRAGGIQNYLQALVDRLPPGEVAVYAPAWPGRAPSSTPQPPYPVHRHPTSLMLPVPTVARRAAQLARAHGASTVWFGAAAPLALLGPRLRRHAGIRRVVASTHGHEVGWSMLPVARQALGRIGRDADVVTVVSRYTRGRFAAAFGPDAALELLPPGVDAAVFRPDPQARATLRRRYGLGDAPVVTCVSRLVARKGQDQLLRALPLLRAPGAGDAAPARRRRPGRRAAASAGRCPGRHRARRLHRSGARPRSCPRTTRSATCSRCPAAPAAAGWTSRAWGSSCWRPRQSGLPVVGG